MKQVIGQQGEVRIIKIDALPEAMQTKNVDRIAKGFVISHSESGHHHCVTGGDVMERIDNVPEGMQVFFAILENPEELCRTLPTRTAATILNPAFMSSA